MKIEAVDKVMEVVLFDRGHALSLFMDRVKPAEACWIWIGNYDKSRPLTVYRFSH